MRKTWCTLCVVGMVLAAGTVQSGDPAEPRAIVDRAIKALGGEANLSKHKAITLKGGGTYYGAGDGVAYTGEWAFQLPGQMRVAIDSKAGDQPFRFVIVVNGDKAWNKFGDNEVMEMNKEQVAEHREQLYAKWVAMLVPLKDKAFKLAALGEVKVQDRAAVGVRVSREGHRDISLYFDKVSGLPCKMETVVKNIETGGDQEVPQEAFVSDYKEFDGIKHATKSVVKRDGKRFVDVEFSEIRPAEKLDDSTFARP